MEKEGAGLVDTRALKAHRAAATRMARVQYVQDGRSRADGEGEETTSGCFEKVHILLALYTRRLRRPSPTSLPVSSTLTSPYREWRLRPGCTPYR